MASNRDNLARRYELTPYYYSLAHKAFADGDPLVPPLVYHYQNDPNVREMGHEKMIGRDLLVGVVAGAGERSRDMYLAERELIAARDLRHEGEQGDKRGAEREAVKWLQRAGLPNNPVGRHSSTIRNSA